MGWVPYLCMRRLDMAEHVLHWKVGSTWMGLSSFLETAYQKTFFQYKSLADNLQKSYLTPPCSTYSERRIPHRTTAPGFFKVQASGGKKIRPLDARACTEQRRRLNKKNKSNEDAKDKEEKSKASKNKLNEIYRRETEKTLTCHLRNKYSSYTRCVTVQH